RRDITVIGEQSQHVGASGIRGDERIGDRGVLIDDLAWSRDRGPLGAYTDWIHHATGSDRAIELQGHLHNARGIGSGVHHRPSNYRIVRKVVDFRQGKRATTLRLLAFVIVCTAVLIMRRTNPDVHRPFRAPLGPVVPVMGILCCLLLMFSLPAENWARLFVWLAVGLVIYFAYGRKHSVMARRVA
ncbi:hypothetical protein B4Q13_22900, partial [Lacticaseibacillus rhamnosus]